VTKSELIEAVSSRKPELSKKDVETVVNTVFDTMVSAMAQDFRIEIRGFGSFVVKRRAARDGRNPKTGEKVFVPTKRIPFFTVGKELRERVDGQDGAHAHDGSRGQDGSQGHDGVHGHDGAPGHDGAHGHDGVHGGHGSHGSSESHGGAEAPDAEASLRASSDGGDGI